MFTSFEIQQFIYKHVEKLLGIQMKFQKHLMKVTFGVIIIILIVLLYLLFYLSWDKDTKTLILQYSTFSITILGFYIAIRQIIKGKENYLEIFIDTKTANQFYSIKTQVYNKSGENRDIKYAFILITKQNANIVFCANKILNHCKAGIQFKYSNDFNNFYDIIKEPLFLEDQIGIIPLEYYYSENIQIGNESPAYTFTFKNEPLSLEKGIYSVRFFVYPKTGYHRSTVESLIIT